jgi:T-complex protein 1 subunit theta
MQKLIVNHIDKLFVSNDASTILREININHPAANLINMAA